MWGSKVVRPFAVLPASSVLLLAVFMPWGEFGTRQDNTTTSDPHYTEQSLFLKISDCKPPSSPIFFCQLHWGKTHNRVYTFIHRHTSPVTLAIWAWVYSLECCCHGNVISMPAQIPQHLLVLPPASYCAPQDAELGTRHLLSQGFFLSSPQG